MIIRLMIVLLLFTFFVCQGQEIKNAGTTFENISGNMDTAILCKTAQRAIEAYGGVEFWNSVKRIEAEVSATGFAFRMKKRPFFNCAKLEMEVNKPVCSLTPIGKDSNISGVLEGSCVMLKDFKGKIIEKREDPEKYFPYGKRTFRWDDLDMAYFANYAFWNYFSLPVLLMNPDIIWREVENGVLEAEFPETIPTHCKVQKFYFDTISGLLVRHDYTVDIFGSWAKVGNVVLEHTSFSGIAGDLRRKVTPRATKKKLLGFPVMIDITVHDVRYFF